MFKYSEESGDAWLVTRTVARVTLGLSISMFRYFTWYAAFLSRRPYAAPRALLDPFHALKLFLKADNVALLRRLRSLKGAGLNILLFVPFGYLLPLLWKWADR